MSQIQPKIRLRSPRFPGHTLEEAIGYARRIYDGVHRAAIDADSAFQLMGFSGKSGSSATALGSIRQFGLIDGHGDKTRISDLALAILEPESEFEKSEAIARAARKPDVFDAIFSRFEERVPAANEPIRAFLIRELGFQKNSADDCIESLRKSLSYAELHATVLPIDPLADQTVSVTDSEAGTERRGVFTISHAKIQPTQNAIIPLTRDCRAELLIFGNLSDKAIENLKRHIELLVDVWREE